MENGHAFTIINVEEGHAPRLSEDHRAWVSSIARFRISRVASTVAPFNFSAELSDYSLFRCSHLEGENGGSTSKHYAPPSSPRVFPGSGLPKLPISGPGL